MNDQVGALLSIDHLVKSYYQFHTEKKILDDVSLHIGEGEIVSIVGPSGCGKSTLLNIIAGFDRDYRGKVLFNGGPITGPSIERGVIFQNPQLFSWLKIQDNIAYGLRRNKTEKDLIAAQINGYLTRMDLLEFRGYYPDQLSGGMQQRVSLARVLVMKPKLLLMDEPFSSLDYQSRLRMQGLTLELWEEYKPSIVFITHDIEEAILVADRVIVLSKLPGKIIQEINVPFRRPRELALIKSIEFNQIKAEILDLLVFSE